MKDRSSPCFATVNCRLSGRFAEASLHEGGSIEGLRRIGYSGLDVFVLCFSLEDKKAFQTLNKEWAQDLRSVKNHNPNVPVFVIATHSDKPAIDPMEALSIATNFEALKYFAVNTDSGEGVKEALFSIIAHAIGVKYDESSCSFVSAGV